VSLYIRAAVVLWKKGVAIEPELNKYEHPRMSRKQWEAIYREPWPLYYTPSSEPGSGVRQKNSMIPSCISS
jgi:hypothetical protein